MNTNIKSPQQVIDLAWQAFLAFAIVIGVTMIPMEALASSNAISIALCNAVILITGPAGKAIATVAIIVIGLGALMGKVSWGMALIVALGIALVFGAATIVNQLGASNASSCGNTYSNISSR